MAGQDQSPLMRLAPELRNRIYQMVFEDTEVVLPDASKSHQGGMRVPGILMACRQVHEEAVGLFYSNAVFTTSEHPRLLLWFDRLPLKYVMLLENVHYDWATSCKWLGVKQRQHFAKLLAQAAENTLTRLNNILLSKATIKRARTTSGACNTNEGTLQHFAITGSVKTYTGETVWTGNSLETYLSSGPGG
ncbi:hypothetical protein LTR08_002645 [Meristemomyces frigidus]|nr:hypothetical protein LTR08_002645 [Meristemomyces frigidus]